MAATQQQQQRHQQPNGVNNRNTQDKQQPNVLMRVFHIPLINDTVNQFTQIVQSFGITAAIYSRTEQLACHVLKLSEPIQNMLPLARLNSFANQCVDVLERQFPRAFQVHADELFAQAKASAMKPADAAQKVFHERLTGAQASLSSAQDRLTHMVESLPRNSEEAQRAVQDLVNEMAKTRDSVMAQAKDMPANVRANVEPLMQDFQAGLSHVSQELQRQDVPVQQRVMNSAQYLRENTAEALSKIMAVLNRKKEEANKSYAEVTRE